MLISPIQSKKYDLVGERQVCLDQPALVGMSISGRSALHTAAAEAAGC